MNEVYIKVCVILQNMLEASGSFYTADKNFTRPPVATVATNSKSAQLLLQTFQAAPVKHLKAIKVNLAIFT